MKTEKIAEEVGRLVAEHIAAAPLRSVPLGELYRELQGRLGRVTPVSSMMPCVTWWLLVRFSCLRGPGPCTGTRPRMLPTGWPGSDGLSGTRRQTLTDSPTLVE